MDIFGSIKSNVSENQLCIETTLGDYKSESVLENIVFDRQHSQKCHILFMKRVQF